MNVWKQIEALHAKHQADLAALAAKATTAFKAGFGVTWADSNKVVPDRASNGRWSVQLRRRGAERLEFGGFTHDEVLSRVKAYADTLAKRPS